MRGMQWSWDDLENTPVYVRRYCADFLAIEARAANARAGKPQQQPGG